MLLASLRRIFSLQETAKHRLREQVNSLTSSNKHVNQEYEKKVKDLESQAVDIVKDKENLELQLVKSNDEHNELHAKLEEMNKYTEKLKAEISQVKVQDFNEKSKHEEIKALNKELRLVNEKKDKLSKQSSTVVLYNANRFEKTCQELEEKTKKKDEGITKYEAELSKVSEEIQKLKEEKKKEPSKPPGKAEIKKLKERNIELQFEHEKIMQEYDDSKAAWDDENSAIKNDLDSLEKQTVAKKIECANVASDLDTLIVMYEQHAKELESYGKHVGVRFEIA